VANTYADNPARGLSKLQSAILLWAKSGYEDYIARGYPSMVTGATAPGVPWALRPTFYGEAASTSFTGGTAYGRRGDKTKKKQGREAPAVSRALKRLEERGLVECVKYHGRTQGIRLTQEGERLVEELVASEQNG